MQLIPATARRFGVSDVFDPMENLQGGARYLKYLLNLYDGDDRLALAAYNAGEGAVARWGGVPPYRETQGYLRQVRRGLEEMQAQAPRPEALRQPSAPGAVPSVPAQNSIREVMDADGRVRYISQ
jgi:soluble lytic murein transglycosylase-like protein